MNLSHLDDEQLSAHLDGEGAGGAAEHLASCQDCEQRLTSLLMVSSLVGAAGAGPDTHVRDGALQAARAEWLATRDGAADGGEAEVVSLGERRRMPRWALPVAAAAAALLLAVPLIATLGDGRGNRDETAARLGDQSFSGGADAETAGFDGGDLGEQSDPATLARAIRGALPGAATEDALAASPPPPSAAATPTAEAPDVPAPTSVGAPETEGSRSAGSAGAAAGKAQQAAPRPCSGIARTTYGKGLGPLVYSALVRWQGTPAVVLAYRLADAGAPGLDYRVLVMAQEDCRLLVGQSL